MYLENHYLIGSAFDNIIVFELNGKKEKLIPLLKESGGHRWQRIPPTEHKGRVHTSTVTVAVLEVIEKGKFKLKNNDISIKYSRGSGPGGQHRNKTDSCVLMTHIPTGITARIDGRSQHQNKEVAREILESRVLQAKEEKLYSKMDKDRRNKIGSGQRGDKIRTYRVRDNIVIDHKSNKKISLRKVLSGKLEF